MLAPPTWMGEWVSLFVLLIGAFSTISAAVLLPIYWRRLQMKAAQTDLAQVQMETIATLQHEVHSVRRMLEVHVTNVAECEKRLRAAEASVAKWEDMLGGIWLREFATEQEEP
jgi:hypothetical protein